MPLKTKKRALLKLFAAHKKQQKKYEKKVKGMHELRKYRRLYPETSIYK